MNPQQREQLRLSTLRCCELASSYGLATPLLRQFLISEGVRNLTDDSLRAELLYLVDKGLIAPVPKLISPEVEAWRITAAGRDFLSQRGI